MFNTLRKNSFSENKRERYKLILTLYNLCSHHFPAHPLNFTSLFYHLPSPSSSSFFVTFLTKFPIPVYMVHLTCDMDYYDISIISSFLTPRRVSEIFFSLRNFDFLNHSDSEKRNLYPLLKIERCSFGRKEISHFVLASVNPNFLQTFWEKPSSS